MSTPTALTDGRLFYKTTEVAELFSVDPRTIRRAIQDGEIPATSIGRTLRVSGSWVRQQLGLGPEISEPAPATGTGFATDPPQVNEEVSNENTP